MKLLVTLEWITQFIRELLFSKELLAEARRKETDFTRVRKMPFTDLMLFMINLVRTSSQVSLNRFLSNAIAIAAGEAQEVVDEERKDKENPYTYKVNANQAIGNFKDRYIKILLEKTQEKEERHQIT